MRYAEIQPEIQLTRFVECFWTLESDGTTRLIKPEIILPDGCVELILNFGAQFVEYGDNGKRERQPMHFLVGQITRPRLILPTGAVQLIGVRFHPGGTFPFFRMPMQGLTNTLIEIGALENDFQRELVNRVADEPSLSQKIRLVEQFLIEQVRHCKHNSWIMSLAARIVAEAGQVSVDVIASDAGISPRQLERKFLHEVGRAQTALPYPAIPKNLSFRQRERW